MILTCPQCQTRYQADASQFAPAGRTVRCAKCGHAWRQAPPEPEPDPDLFPLDAPSAADATTSSSITHSAAARQDFGIRHHPQPITKPASAWVEKVAIAGGWAGLVAIILLIGWMALRFRQEIAVLWPQSSSLYAALGVPVNVRGIEFSGVTYRRDVEDGQVVLAVSGNLVNISRREQTVPTIVVTVTDADQHELYHWSFSAPKSTLTAGQTIAFLTRLPRPPAGARHLKLRFATTPE